MARLNEFMRTTNNPEKCIGVTISGKNKEKFEENREILTPIIKFLEFCGRQGIGLKSHRDANTTSSFNNCNFNELLEFRANSGDNALRKHLDAGKRNAMYTSKTIKLHKMIFWNASRSLYKEKFTRMLPANRRDYCLESKPTKLQILQALSSWESF